MPTGLKRYYGRNDLHFLTFSCYRRLPLRSTERARNLFVQELARVRAEFGFKLIGYVIMLNHVHLLMSEPAKGTPSTVMQMLKQRVSRKLRNHKKKRSSIQMEFPFDEDGQELKAFWRERFYDFNVYRSGKLQEKLNYMHANPVTRGLVQHPKDWPWSSWSFYFHDGKGLLPMDLLTD